MRIGDRLLGRYDVTAHLGWGGMGQVFRARDDLLGREVGLKYIPPEILARLDADALAREARKLARLDHPAIVPIHDFGSLDSGLVFIMPWVGGVLLRDRLREGPLPVDLVLEIGVQAAEGLAFSHELGIAHRDLRPETMIFSEDSAGRRLRLLDFALLPEVEILCGAPCPDALRAYRSPQCLAGSRDADDEMSGDLYALAAVLYEALGGMAPYRGDQLAPAGEGLVHPEPPLLRTLRPEIDGGFEALLQRCLSRDPAERPASSQDLIGALRRLRARLQAEQRLEFLGTAMAEPIGRGRERRELREHLAMALHGECRLVLLGGEAGIGKSALLDELAETARRQDLRTLRGGLTEREAVVPYLVFCEWILDFFRQAEAPPDLGLLAPELLAHFPLLAALPALRTTSAASAPRRESAAIYELLARTLIRLSGGSPLVLLAENLHLGDTSLAALEYVVERLAMTPTLIVGTFRNAEIDRGHPLRRVLAKVGDGSRCSVRILEPLDAVELHELTAAVLGGEVEPDLVDQLHESTDGHPGFAQELIRDLVESGGVRRDETGVWALSRRIVEAGRALPTGLRRVVEERVARLPENRRAVLELASVLGKRFTERDLGALAEPELDLDEALDGLIELGLFEEERRGRSDRLSFGSSVVREVVYRHLAPRRRRLLHQRYAEALEARFESGRSGLAPHLLRHVQAAGDVERTVRFGRETAAEALRAFSPREAIQALETALEVVVELPRERGAAEAELRLYMARAQTMAGNHSRGLSESERAAAGFAHLGDDEHRLEAVLVAAEAAWSGRRVEAAHFWVQQGIEFARARGRRADLVRLLNLAAMAANLSGEHVAARNYLEEVEELRRRAPSDPASTDVGGSSPVYSAPMGEVALGELHVPQTATLETLDPAAGDFVDHLEIVANVFETLTRLGEGMRVEPWLARRFEVEEGGGRYRLELREARFHDGRRLSAHDVRYTFERLLRLPSPDLHHYLLPIRGARAWRDGLSERLEGCLVIDPRRLVLELERPLVFFPALLSHPALAILPEGAAEGDPSWWLRGVGTGPFRIGRVEPGERVELERHPDYWRPATPRLERLIFHGGLEPREILRRFRAGRLDVASDLRPEDVEALCRDREFAGGFREAPRLCTYYLGFGSHRGLFADLPRRRALAQLLDVDRPFRAALQRAAIRATTFLPPGLNGAAPRAFERPAPLADTEARALLRGRTVRVAVYPSYLGQYADFWERLRTQLDDLGMVVETRLGAPAELDALLPTGEIDLILDRWLADYPDADAFAFALLHSTEGALAGFGGSPEIDRLADGARRERDPVRRRAMYDRIEEILHREALIVPFFHEQLYRFYHPSVRHLRVRLFAPEVRYDEIFIDPSAAFENRGRARK